MDEEERSNLYSEWKRAIKRSLAWEDSEDDDVIQ